MAISKRESKKNITHFVVFGDSLSDGKNMGEKFSFLGSWVKGLWLKALGLDKSPNERFTNGYTWADSLRATLISKFLNDDKIKKDSAHRFGRYNLNNADISDDVLYQSPYLRKRYTWDEVTAELREVKRKQRVEDREEGHLFAAKQEGTPEDLINPRHIVDSTDIADAAIAHRHKTNAQRTALHESSDDISDQIITDPRYSKYIQEYYSLDDGRTAQYNGQNFFANYSQGGATSYDYSWKSLFLSLLAPFTSIKLFFTRLIVSNLSKQVDQFLADLEKQEDYEDKEKTLVTVFSGANDLITVNSEPTKEAANLAVQSNIDNIEKLIQQGFKNIVLCNLPDLSLTPRFQGTSREGTAHEVTEYFNTQLEEKYKKLKEKYPSCSIDFFNINSIFTKIYTDVQDNPQSEYAQYFDPKKLKEAYKDSADYTMTPERTSPGSKHMFWDDVHPTTTMHALLMSEFYKNINALGKYKISAPAEQSPEQLCKKFRQKYHEKLENSRFGFLNSNKELSINYKEPAKALHTILRFALDKNNKKADYIRKAMIDLGWWVNNKPNMCIPALADAMWILDPTLARQLEAKLDPHLEQPHSNSPRMIMGALNAGSPRHKTIPPELALPPEVEKKLKMMQNSPNKDKDATLPKPKGSTTFETQELSTRDNTLTLV
ncbi:SGNH/GDSL hydrolase family protein [Legionella cincinnatiensis]|uniref:Lipolytic enzyme, GDSL family n=1 Tax=Legionella cincinnatiensis TaxID=28085 RepID=A0A378IKV9_9GAMM|nr:SGNH/GDSL hydrolase family protein [Legionella cincinnatiensis]KTC83052.1 lipolytic enzyme, GDSL family [Legionella cincinnatiensis]STX35908.1 lipolytic enzyme, GDSL family [Legionella cincinnatiensis]